ncbi:MAG: 3-phosphoglycerate dehydrogenase [Clostridia bacterium]|nr:3-phosphoglycerate dehydrogenase [Clostridia bacterium]MBQ7047894.1 3-phosphoglycerate dehydrogenase [Clostridia bacterium]
MKNIALLNKIGAAGLKQFDSAKYNVGCEAADADAIMVRSAAMHDMEFGKNLVAIARAGAGVNNIPVDRCTEEGIVVFNTPGANANGVKELTMAALLLASRNIYGGISWANGLTAEEDVAKAVEKGKSAFVGPELKGKTLGVIGLGAIGGLVANCANSLGMKVIGCDPFLTVDNAWHLSRSIIKANSFDEVFEKSDYISVHVPSTKDTKGMFNARSFSLMKDGVRIVNLSRADLVNIADLKAAIADGKVASYVTDFPTNDTINCDKIVCIPHLGASTPESEENCALMAANELIDYVENGIIKNSVNYPNIDMPIQAKTRVLVLHENVPNTLAQISAVLSNSGANIESMLNRSKGANACSVLDTNADISDEVIANINAIAGVRRTIVL